MEFWIIIAGLALLTTVTLVLASRRGSVGPQDAASYDLRVYKDQLAEVERDLARGVIDPADAERVRTEISRRILAADATDRGADADRSDTAFWIWAAVVAVVTIGGSGGLYLALGVPGYGDLALEDRIAMAQELRETRPSQASAEASLADRGPATLEAPNPEYATLVEQLREVVAARPDDAQGHRLLAISERNLGNFAEAHAAFLRYVVLRGADVTGSEFADLADMLILSAGGYVSPEAEAALSRALQLEPRNAPARYYWGLMMSQVGRPDQAFRIWDALLREGPADAPWVAPIQAQIEDMAQRAGVDYTMPAPGPGARGPSAADVEAAGDMTPAERMEMIEGMVGNLAERLSEEGGPASDWARLITALGVLGRTDDAFDVYQNAIRVFAEDPTSLDQINRAGDRAGVAN